MRAAANLKLALRQIRRQPGPALTVIVTLALAIGASTAIFSFVNALLIRPFPFRDPEQLVEIRSIRGGQPGKLSMVEILDIKEQAASLESIAAHTTGQGGYNYSGDGRPEEWPTILTTGNLFEVLGLPLVAGAPWPEPVDRQRDFKVILSHGVWRNTFGGRGDAVGKRIALDHAPGYEIMGVAPEGFDYSRGVRVYRSIGGFTSYDRRDSRNVVGIARVKRPHTPERLQAELDAVSRRLAQQFPDTNAGISYQAIPFRKLYSGDVRPYLLILLGAVGFVLLIACGNTVNLLLSRALAREREMAVRTALGATRRDLIGQLLTESVLLSLTAALAGLALAWWWMKALRALIGAQLPEWMPVEMDTRVLIFTILVALVSGIAAGLAPALHSSRPDLGEALKEGGRGSSSGRGARQLRDWMVVGEVALAVMLLAGAGLLIRGFLALQSQDKGFRAESVATFRVALGWRRYIDQQTISRYYQQALEKLRGIPGVSDAAFISYPPLSRQEDGEPSTVQKEGQGLDEALRNPYVNHQSVSENYLQFAGIALKAGRRFSEFDGEGSEPVAIVSERLAKVLWPGQDSLGRRLRYNHNARRPGVYCKVVGVAANVQHRELGGEAGLDLYVPYRQSAAANQYLLAKTNLSLPRFQTAAEQALWSIDHEQSLFDFQTYEQRILDSIWQLRISQMLLVLFGGVAVALAAIGIYGVISYMAGQRRREMGIRLALGATPAEVRRIVIRRGLILGGVGLAIGLGGALALGRMLEVLVRGVKGSDSASFAASCAILLSVTLAACALPAWRASRIDPASTLRRD